MNIAEHVNRRSGIMAGMLLVLVLCILSSYKSTRSTVSNHLMVPAPNTMKYVQNDGQIKCNNSAANYITTNDRGRTGNLLFKLFSLVGIATDIGLTPLLQPTMARKLSRLLNVSMLGTTQKGITYHWKTFKELSSRLIDKRVQALDPACNWMLKGYYQSWKYFQHYEVNIRENFRFREHLIDKVDLFFKTLSEHQRNNTLNIGIHVRRGDILTPRRLEHGYVDVPRSYFERAIAYFRQKYADKYLNFIVTSNSLKWCEKNIQGRNIHYSPMEEVEEDIVLLSRCDHVITSVGTFSRIVGWFVSGDVIYYSGFPRPGSRMYNHTVLADIFPDTWIGLQ